MTLGWICGDRSWASIEETAKRAGADLTPVKRVSLIDDAWVSMDRYEQNSFRVLLDSAIPKLLPLTHLIVDPLISWLGVPINDYQKVSSKLVQLGREALVKKITITATHHASKARTDYGFKRAQDRIAGSTALLAFTSTQMFLESPEERGDKTLYYTWTVCSHHDAPHTIFLTKNPHGLFEPAPDQPGLVANSAVAMTIWQALQPVGIELSGDDITDRVLQAGLETSRATIFRALARMESEGVLHHVHGSWRAIPPA